MITNYQAKYLAHQLTLRHPSDSNERLAGALVDAQIDAHPHQVEAALFAFRSPLSKGAILADEVGLGKTIEAGLVISQKWAERKRNILIIAPANLRKQWFLELQEKFFLPSRILEAKSYNERIKLGDFRPFDSEDSIIICSYQFARSKASDIHGVNWDLVVMDEAHRLRNVYKPNNKIANTIKQALQKDPKLLLTATPLQNSLLELFGLVSIIDEHTFGDFKSFRDQFARLDNEDVFNILKARLQPICHRTLRRQVTQYINYTKRYPLVEDFMPDEREDRLYNLVSDYLQRDNLVALPASQRSLMTLVLRKLLASSSFAIAGALNTLVTRLERTLKKNVPNDAKLLDEFDEDYEHLDEIAEEWDDDEKQEEPLSAAQIVALKHEIVELKEFRDLAISIEDNAKGRALLTALNKAFDEAERLGAQRKAIIFTESRKTQDYLLRLLQNSDFAKGIVLFNGSNTDDLSKSIYYEWLESNQGSDRVTGSKTADMRTALVDYFRNEGEIMIATEAGAEGINLQFCSLVVNYDLPWNPQRIEQRIGRCHRYGQKHDVVVVNFVNRNNEADQRVFDLLNEKFQLFSGVFGASDEVLGAIESGVDFEKRIAGIYQQCRTQDEIKERFDSLQLELEFEIREAMQNTRKQLLDNFDQEVHDKLKLRDESTTEALGKYERLLMQLTRHELKTAAEFPTGDGSFELITNPFSDRNEIPLGKYELPRRSGDAHFYRLGHPLAEEVISHAKKRELPPAAVIFDYSHTPGKVSILKPLIGRSGEITISLMTVEALDQAEDYLIYAGVTEDGSELNEDQIARMLGLLGKLGQADLVLRHEEALKQITSSRESEIRLRITERNATFFEQEAAKLDNWAEDLKVGLEKEIKEYDRLIKEAKKASTMASSLQDKLEAQKQIKKLENERKHKRTSLFEAQDEIDEQREELISSIEAKLSENVLSECLFRLSWRLI
jgi:ERCC4-related helicase